MKIFKDHTPTDELGICRTRVIYALAGGERGQESMAWNLKKLISPALHHRWNKARRRHWILICASPQEFVNFANAGATGLFCGYFRTF
jgi:hypothetical protein